MNNQTRGNSRRGRSRRGRGQYFVGNMGHPQNGGGPGQAPVPFPPPPPPPPPPVVAYLVRTLQPYFYPPPVAYQNVVPLGYYPYAHHVPAYMPPPPQGQVNQATQVPGQNHGLRLRRRHRSRVQPRGRGNGRGNRGQPNRRQVGRGNSSVRQAPVAQGSSSEAGPAGRNSLAVLPVPLEQSSDLDGREVKQEDTEDESTPVAQNIGSTEIKREPVIKQEPKYVSARDCWISYRGSIGHLQFQHAIFPRISGYDS
ncbi:hypothetical protein FPRO05_07157 [Fusarium proliferatum]|uniref:Uncharacterized protein n=1 Tax=Gibberella intermedia TaxID=948311 RepID=A0A365MK66_GIBIN|nr:hypothetical protein FPRO05_07157 [Fusarium proliferatum]